MTILLGEALSVLYAIVLRAGGGSGGGHSSGGGGGGGFSSSGGGFSSGGSSGSYSGGSGSIGGLIFGLVCFGVILLVVFLAKNSAGKIGGATQAFAGLAAAGTAMAMANDNVTGGYLDGTDETALRTTSIDQINAGVEAIRAHDPDFDPAAFAALVNRAFFAIQQAWTERKPDLSRQVMADGIWQQHKFQIDQYISLNHQNILENLAIQNTFLVGVTVSGGYDTIMVRFFASCADYDIDLGKKNKVIKGSKNIEEWCEDWCFQRSSEATTKVDGGTFAKKCPNCGAPLDVDLAGTCQYCKAPIMGGRYDWVLTRIEQLPSWEFGQSTLPR